MPNERDENKLTLRHGMKSQEPEDKKNTKCLEREKRGHIQKTWCQNYFGLHYSWKLASMLEARLKWSSTIKVLRANDYTSVFPYVAIIPSKYEGRINKDVFSNERPQKFTSYEQQQKTLRYSGHR